MSQVSVDEQANDAKHAGQRPGHGAVALDLLKLQSDALFVVCGPWSPLGQAPEPGAWDQAWQTPALPGDAVAESLGFSPDAQPALINLLQRWAGVPSLSGVVVLVQGPLEGPAQTMPLPQAVGVLCAHAAQHGRAQARWHLPTGHTAVVALMRQAGARDHKTGASDAVPAAACRLSHKPMANGKMGCSVLEDEALCLLGSWVCHKPPLTAVQPPALPGAAANAALVAVSQGTLWATGTAANDPTVAGMAAWQAGWAVAGPAQPSQPPATPIDQTTNAPNPAADAHWGAGLGSGCTPEVLSAILDLSPLSVMVVDAMGHCVMANRQAQKLLELGQGPSDSGDPVWDAMQDAAWDHPTVWSGSLSTEWHTVFGEHDWDGELVHFADGLLGRMLKTGQPVRDLQLAKTLRSGEKRLFLVNGQPLFDEQGRVHSVVVALQDATHQHRAMKELERNESRYRRLVESQLDLVCRCGKDGTIAFANKAFCKLFDTDLASLVGQRFEDLVTTSHTPVPLPDLVPVGGTYVTEQSVLDGQGASRHVQWIHRSISNAQGNDIEYLAVGRDITERRQAERALKQMKDRLSLIIEKCPAIFFTAEPHPPFGITYISGRNEALSGYSPEEFMTPPDRWQHLIHPQDLPVQLQELQRARHTRAGRLEFRLLTKTGEYRWFQKDFVAVENEAGEVVEVVGFVVDIHEQKISEQVLRDSREHYRQMAKNNQRLLSEVNHRVRNNLSSLLGLLRMAELDQSQSDRLAERLRTRLFAMARLHNMLAGVHWQDLQLKQVINELLAVPDLLHPQAKAIVVPGPDVALPPRVAQPLAMSITELLINAAKHGAGRCPGGEVQIGWQVVPAGNQGLEIAIDWQEFNGPTIDADTLRPSMGTDLILGFVGYELGGTCHLTYPPEGAHHTLCFPIPEASSVN